MKIELMIDGEKKRFKAPRVKGRMLRKTFELNSELASGVVDAETLDKVVEHICDVFENKFTIDQFYDGLYADEIYEVIQDVFEKIVNPKGVKGDQKN